MKPNSIIVHASQRTEDQRKQPRQKSDTKKKSKDTFKDILQAELQKRT